MARILFGSPVFSDPSALFTPTLAGGLWEAALPLANVQDRRLARVARTQDAALTSGIITVDLGVARAVRAVGIFGHSLSTAASWRVRGSTAVLTNVAANPQAPNSWGNVGTPVVTTGASDPWGGTAAILIEDNDAGASEGKETGCTFTGDGTKYAIVAISPGTASVVRLRLYDNTAAATRHELTVTWQGGTTAPVCATVGGAGTLFDPIPVYNWDGRLYWLIPFSATGIVAANTNVLNAYVPAADTGTFYLAGGEAFDLDGTELLHDAGGPVWPSGQTLETLASPPDIITAFDAVTARYWRIEVMDPTNADGYLDVGRLTICGGWQPGFNVSYGARLGLETDSTRQLTDGGASIHTTRPVRRTFVGAIADLDEDDALAGAFDLQRYLGTSGQLLVVPDPDDTTHMHRRAFLGTWKDLSGFEHSHLSRMGVPLSLVEEL